MLGDVTGATFDGRVVVSYATSTPDIARATAAWAVDRGITWLSGAVMVPTPLIGGPDALLLHAGESDVFSRCAPVLGVVGGDARHVGADHGLASLLDTAMLDVFFAGMTAFLHATAMVTAQGVSATDFLPFARLMTDALPTSLKSLARDVDAGVYPGDEDNIAMERAALRHIAATSDDLGLDSRLPHLMLDLASAAVESGHGEEGWSRIVDLLRRPA